jgi:hypothetical protein
MAELINLRTARKRAQRRDDDSRAAENRVAHGQPKSHRKLEAARKEKAKQDLDRHRIDKGGDR